MSYIDSDEADKQPKLWPYTLAMVVVIVIVMAIVLLAYYSTSPRIGRW